MRRQKMLHVGMTLWTVYQKQSERMTTRLRMVLKQKRSHLQRRNDYLQLLSLRSFWIRSLPP